MLRWLLQLPGIKVDAVTRVVGAKLELGGGLAIGWVLLLGVGLIGLATWTYRRTDRLTRARRVVLTSLRAALLGLLLLILLRPAIAYTVEGSIRRTLLLLVDGSSSMQIQDPRSDVSDVQRANLALGRIDPDKGLDQTNPGAPPLVSRLELVRKVFTGERLDLLPKLRKSYDLRPFAFGADVKELNGGNGQGAREPSAWVARLQADDPATALGDAVRQTLSRLRGQPLAGVVLVTDGANNAGEQPLAAAELAKLDGVPLYVYGVGISAPRDIIVSNVFAPEVAFFDDDLPVTVRLKSRGLDGQTATVKLELVNRRGGAVEQTVQREVPLAEGEQVLAMSLTPKQSNQEEHQQEYELRVSVLPRDDEAVKDNNAATQRLRLIDGKIKVLYVEQSPRWEFRFLQALLLRDRRVQLKCVLLEADPSVSQGENSPYLPGIPTKREELFGYDLILLGDVDPKLLSAQQVADLDEFVSRFGGGLLLLAGRQHNPSGYRGTPLEKLMPIEPGAPMGAATESAARPIQIEPTPAGKQATMLQLSDKPQENERLWRSLPPLYWTARVDRAKPAAQVLLVDPSPEQASRFGAMPVIALQQYGAGQVLFVGSDNLWRWRRNRGEDHYTTLWSQMVRRLALPHLMGESMRTQLTADRKTYTTGDRVTIYARLYGPDYTPRTDPTVRGSYAVDGRSNSMQLRAVPEQPGMYRGEFVATEPGTYQFTIDDDRQNKLEFIVEPPRLELGETAMQEKLLRQMADASGGAFVREEDLYKLPELIEARDQTVRSTHTVELWSNPIYFLLVLTVAGLEWFLRKRAQLK